MESKEEDSSMEARVDQKSSSSTTTTRSNIDISLTIGREFSSFKEFEQVLEARKQAIGERWRVHKSKLWSTHNKTIDNPSYHVPEKLQYKEIEMRCIHEGDRLTSESKGPVKFRKT